MIPIRLIPVVLKQVWRHRTRSLLTVAGVTVAMFLFVAVQTLQRGVHEATSVTAADTTLVVYRENRFCPAASRLPERYESRIEKLPGVVSVTPMKILVNNCRASLDVIIFRGLAPENLPRVSKSWEVVAGSLDDWGARSDAAVVGERLATRRGFTVGGAFNSSGVSVTVVAIIKSSEPQDENVAYVHLDFLQRVAKGAGLGLVTQFNVKVDDPAKLESVAKAIDAEFTRDQEPTTTRPEKAFVAQAGTDIVQIVSFTRFLGWGCLAAVLALVGNAIVLSVQDRVKEHAVLQTLGYRRGLIARMIVAESVLMGLIGGGIGTAAAMMVVRYGHFTLANEGLTVSIKADPWVVVIGLAISAAVGVVAGLAPALQAGRREIAHCFRAV
jgi:putative ABC transport system permease protein